MSWFLNGLVLVATAPLFICWAIETVNACREAMAIRWYIGIARRQHRSFV